MNKEKVINAISERFEKYKEKTFLIYGVGGTAKNFLEKHKVLDIAGLIDRNLVGEKVYGLEVFSIDEVFYFTQWAHIHYTRVTYNDIFPSMCTYVSPPDINDFYHMPLPENDMM